MYTDLFAETPKKKEILISAKIEEVSEAKVKVFPVHAMVVCLGVGVVEVVVAVYHRSVLALLQ